MGGRKRDWSKNQKREQMRRHGTQSVADELPAVDHTDDMRSRHRSADQRDNQTTPRFGAVPVYEFEPSTKLIKKGENRRSLLKKIDKMQEAGAKASKLQPKPMPDSPIIHSGKKNLMEGVVVERRLNGVTIRRRDAGTSK